MSCGCGCGGEQVAYEDWDEAEVTAAEYQGRKVTLNKPFRTPGANKKFGVYTMGPNGNVVIVRFGDPNMEIKRDDPERRRNFRSRHNCDSPGPKYKARYWSCRQWESGRKVEAMEEPCGCNNEEVKAEMIRRDVFDNPGEAMSRAREMGCDKIHSHDEDGKTVFMPCETHQEYMDKNDGMDVEQREEVESYHHDDDEKRAMMHKKKKKKDEDEYNALHYNGHEPEPYKTRNIKYNSSYHTKSSCEPGYKKVDGKCKKIAVTLDVEIEDVIARVSAETGETIYEIRGLAFHEGMNKTKWSLTPAGAKSVVSQMQGADLTLMHPKANEHGAGFTRNAEGIEEGNVGYILNASFFTTNAGYDVRYVAHVTRQELFASMEDGLWKQDGYGVSIGGSGVPVSADEDGLVFDEDFTFDHLALVKRPAYKRASVDSIEKKVVKQLPTASEKEETFIGQRASGVNQPKVIAMTDETNEINYEAEMEAVKADLVLANSRIAEYEAVEAQRVEDERMALVTKASDLGMSGHEDLSTPTLETLIASWEAAHPEPAPVEMTPVESVEKPVAEPAVASEDTPKVSNYLNGKMISNDEAIYSKAYNAWASAWNKTLAADERSRMTAHKYEALKEMN